jgi:hypothetical protein
MSSSGRNQTKVFDVRKIDICEKKNLTIWHTKALNFFTFVRIRIQIPNPHPDTISLVQAVLQLIHNSTLLISCGSSLPYSNWNTPVIQMVRYTA